MLKPAFIDLSHHNIVPQSLIPAKQSGIVGVIHKLTEGTGFMDDKCDNRFFLAKQARLMWGLYHFIRPGHIEDQAQYFVNASEGVSDEATLYCLDWEDASVSAADALRFLEVVEQLTDRSPVLYSGHVLKEHSDPRLTKYRLWLAQYASKPELPAGFTKCWGWQYTDQGDCPGIKSPVDLNAYDGTAAQLRADWSGNGDAPDEAAVTVSIEVPPGVSVAVTVNGETVS